MGPSSDPPSGTSTPRSFMNQTATAEDLLKSSTVGLVNLSDFRKRRAEVLERKEREAQDKTLGRFKSNGSGTVTPNLEGSDGALTPRTDSADQPPRKKKKKVNLAKGKLSFGGNDEEGGDEEPTSTAGTPRDTRALSSGSASPSRASATPPPRRLTPNPNALLPAPKVLTKASLQAEAAEREKLRKEFLVLQEKIKATNILIPFVFYDGTNIPGGTVRVKKGDHIWLFLDRCRKVGAELGVSGSGSNSRNKNDARREWARVGVDDLMCVRGEVIVPHHYELYYFIANQVPNPSGNGGLLFDYSNSALKDTSADADPLARPFEDEVEGADMDPTLTKVVDRRWYEKNKHIFPASLWREYEPGKEFEEKMSKARRDAEGNAFFFS